jgi:hypothetical protein
MNKDPGREALEKAWKELRRQNFLESIPMSHGDLRDLFKYLGRPSAPPCDTTLRSTIEFLRTRGLDVERVIPWLHEYGGYCDCEVIYNVSTTFEEFVGR